MIRGTGASYWRRLLNTAETGTDEEPRDCATMPQGVSIKIFC